MLRPILTVALALVAALGAGQAFAGRPAQVGQLRVVVPAAADAGETVALEFSLPGHAAAVDGRLLFDSQAAELVGLAPIGGGTVIGPQEVEGGAAFGAYGLNRGGRALTALRVIVAPLVAGQLEVRLVIDAAADGAGNRLHLGRQSALGALRVDRGSRRFAAPTDRWQAGPLRAGGRVRDLVPDGILGKMDLDVVRAAWELARANNSACGSVVDEQADANGDGCVDIVDVQAVAAAQGERLSGAADGRTGDSATGVGPGTHLTASIGQQPLSVSPESDQAGLTFVVNSTADSSDANNGDGLCRDSQGRCTLRAAVTESNWQRGDNRIEFDLSGSAPVQIQVNSYLLIQDRTGGVFIDGYSQPGSRVNSAAFGSNAIPGVEIRGTGGSPRGNAFRITSANNVIRGLSFIRHYRTIVMDTVDAHHNSVLGNWMGFDDDGDVEGYRGNHGVRLNNGAHHNFTGGPNVADRNVIGNFTHAVDLYGPKTDYNVTRGNLLCTTPSGNTTASCSTAIDQNFGPKHNDYGGLGAGEGNVIGRTTLNGIEISHGWDPDRDDNSDKWQNNHNRVLGNWIGFRADGRYDPQFRSGQNSPNSNDANGVNVYDGAHFNLVEGNYIASVHDGVNTMSPNTSSTTIRNNVIGESPRGEAAPLNRHGVHVRINSRSHVIEGNIIRNVGGYGIGLTQKDILWVRMSRNIITDMSGTAIYLAPGNNGSSGANNLFPAPQITSATTALIRGSGNSGAMVEIFRASRGAGQFGLPVAYLGSTTVASDGSWSISVDVESGDRVTATQTSTTNNTSSLARNVSVTFESAPPPASSFAEDEFGRNVTNGWGSAATGGGYTLQGTAGNFDVTGGVGTIRVPAAGNSRSALLNNASGQDVDVTFKVAADKVSSGGAYIVYAVVRRNGNSEYRPRLILNPNGSVSVHASRLVGGSESSLGGAVVVPGLTQAAGSFVWLRAQVVGTGPTSIRVKAWADGQAEPAGWAFSATDSTAALQGDGSLGLRVWLNRRVSNAAVTFSFDSYLAEPAD